MQITNKTWNIIALIIGIIGLFTFFYTLIIADNRIGVDKNGFLWFWLFIMSPAALFISYRLKSGKLSFWSLGTNLATLLIIPIMAVIGLLGAIFTN